MIPDPVFGAGFTASRLDLGADDEGPLTATLIHRERHPGDADPCPGRPPVLVLHGWSDYIFHRDLLDHLGAAGHDVWALDLRKYGRSLREGQTPTAIDHLSRYDAEIDAARSAIGRDRMPLVIAHSGGGLIAALYAHRRPGSFAGLVLNSPWLEMHWGTATRRLLEKPVHVIADQVEGRPLMIRGSSHYARTIHRSLGGGFDYDLAWKPVLGHPMPTATFAAILDGQRRLAAAGPLRIPILVLHSARSVFSPHFTDDMRRADAVLDVRTMARAADHLGPDVRRVPLEGARHDVFLSDPDVYREALAVLDDWLGALAAPEPTMAESDRAAVADPGGADA